MTNRERVLATLAHRQPDRTPYSIGFTVPAHEAMVRYTGDRDFAASEQATGERREGRGERTRGGAHRKRV